MNIVITMAGKGERFKKAGYDLPKYQIEVKNKTLFEWSMISLKDFIKDYVKFIFIVKEEENSKCFIEEKCKQLGIKNIHIKQIEGTTDGQATTVLLGEEFWDEKDPLLVYNIDTYVEEGQLKLDDMKGNGFIPCFKGKGNHWSFVKLNEHGEAVEVAEKNRISDNCTLGAYYFKSGKLYKDLYKKYYSSATNLVNGEKYVAPLYNLLIKEMGGVHINCIDEKKIHVLGTPEEVNDFKKID